MGIKISGVKEMTAKLRRMEHLTSKGALAAQRRFAHLIQLRARHYAYRDTGALERSIEVWSGKSYIGGKSRIMTLIGVNEDRLGKSFKRYGTRYDKILHNAPEGMYKPRSKIGRAGPQFLSKAVEDYRDEIARVSREIARRAKRGASL